MRSKIMNFKKIHSFKLMLLGMLLMLFGSIGPQESYDYYLRLVGWTLFVVSGSVGYMKLKLLKS